MPAFAQVSFEGTPVYRDENLLGLTTVSKGKGEEFGDEVYVDQVADELYLDEVTVLTFGSGNGFAITENIIMDRKCI